MAEQARLSFDRGTLILTGSDKEPAADGLHEGCWLWDARLSAWRTEALHYRKVREELALAFGERLANEVGKPAYVKWPRVDLPEFRPEQREALDAWRGAGRRGLVVMPTGTGKTEVALAAMAETGIATLTVSPIRDLMYQWHRRIQRGLGYDAGILGDRLVDVRPVTLTTYDSAYIHMPEIGDGFALVVFDEDNPPEEVRAHWLEWYPGMGKRFCNRKEVQQ